MPLLPVDLDETTAKVLTSLDDLNNITQIGNYTWSSSSRPANTPFTDIACLMSVTNTRYGVIQTIYAAYDKMAIREGTSWSDWSIFFSKDKILTNLRSTFIPTSIQMTYSLDTTKKITIYRSGNMINLRNVISIPAGTYTCSVVYNDEPDLKFLRLAYASHDDVKTFFNNCESLYGNLSINDYSVGDGIELGIGNIVRAGAFDHFYDGGDYSLTLVREQNQWALIYGAFSGEALDVYQFTIFDNLTVLLDSGCCDISIFSTIDTKWN